MAKRYIRVNFLNSPSTSTPLNATNMNKLDKGIDDCDNAIEEIYAKRVNNTVTTNTDTFLAGSVGKLLQDQINAQNENLVGKVLGNLIARFVPYNSILPENDPPINWISTYGYQALIISDLFGWGSRGYGLMVTITGSPGTLYVAQFCISAPGFMARYNSGSNAWTTWV